LHDEHVAVTGDTLGAFPEMRRENRLGGDSIISEETVRSFELGIVEGFGEALSGSIGEARDQQTQPPSQSLVTEVGIREFDVERLDGRGA
jgi:hypothetical protein